MLLKMKGSGSYWRPIIYCDACNERIEDLTTCYFAYDSQGETERDIFFCHKHGCSKIIEERINEIARAEGREKVYINWLNIMHFHLMLFRSIKGNYVSL